MNRAKKAKKAKKKTDKKEYAYEILKAQMITYTARIILRDRIELETIVTHHFLQSQ